MRRQPKSVPKTPRGRMDSNSWNSPIPEPDSLRTLFEQMGFELVARHKSRAIDLYRQGGVNYILNGDRTSFGAR